MKGIAKTREVLLAYVKGGMFSCIKYLSNQDLEFQEGTWVFRAKNLMEANCWRSLEAEINSILYKNNLTNDTKEPGGEDS